MLRFKCKYNDDPGEEVEGKYSADLFVNRATKIFEDQRKLESKGDSKPWFVYLSFQSVHSPLQVNLSIPFSIYFYFNVQKSRKGDFCRGKYDEPFHYTNSE